MEKEQQIYLLGDEGAGKRTIFNLLCKHGEKSTDGYSVKLDAAIKVEILNEISPTSLQNKSSHCIIIFDCTNKTSIKNVRLSQAKLEEYQKLGHVIANKIDLLKEEEEEEEDLHLKAEREDLEEDSPTFLSFSAQENSKENLTKLMRFISNVIRIENNPKRLNKHAPRNIIERRPVDFSDIYQDVEDVDDGVNIPTLQPKKSSCFIL